MGLVSSADFHLLLLSTKEGYWSLGLEGLMGEACTTPLLLQSLQTT